MTLCFREIVSQQRTPLMQLQNGLLNHHLHSTESKHAEKSHLESETHLKPQERPERHCQHRNIRSNNNAVISVVEGNVVNARTPVSRRVVERDGVALEQSDAEDGDHAACVDGLEGVHGVPERLLDAGEALVEC